ncbi:BTAD domain-containing putative transcriptional regulator [Streptomyces sp. NPDC052236]|uniref:AfsR/SARP family transcriptional regulator n=1 Tax=Streptomyces sp. NPDC052236 TaxID=3365686 RepID=UPI0037CCF328
MSARDICPWSGFRLEYEGVHIAVAAHGQRLLAFLGIRGRTNRHLIAGTLWADATEDRAKDSLRSTFWRLRRTQLPLVVSHGDTLALAPEVRDDDWALFDRKRLRQSHPHALEAALQAVRIEPLRESAHRAVVAVHLAENNVVKAVRHFQEFRALLSRELGIEPSPEFTAMLTGCSAANPRSSPVQRRAAVPIGGILASVSGRGSLRAAAVWAGAARAAACRPPRPPGAAARR